MSMRVRWAHNLIRLGEFIESLPVVIMKPDDLVEFNRQTYTNSQDVESWAEDALVDSGLTPDELEMLSAVPETTGDLLLLGIGGGREAIPLARAGFRITGVDFVPAMVDRAIENAARRGVCINGSVQEISQLEVPTGAFNVVWLSSAMYSSIPSRARRVETVRRIANTLKPGGFFLCQFRWDPRSLSSRKGMFVRRLIARLTLGNLAYEAGDMLWGKIEFLHAFSSEGTIRLELEEGGLSVVRIQTNPSTARGGAVCQKRLEP